MNDLNDFIRLQRVFWPPEIVQTWGNAYLGGAPGHPGHGARAPIARRRWRWQSSSCRAGVRPGDNGKGRHVTTSTKLTSVSGRGAGNGTNIGGSREDTTG